MDTPAYEIDPLITAKAIAARVEDLAREIEAHFADTRQLVVVGLLRGSFVFIADVVRELDLPVEVDFLEVSSYGNSTETSREVRRLKTIALLDKPSRREVDVKATWTGFEIPDKFVVGYGIDYAQRNRNLPYIGTVRFLEP